MKLSMFTPGKLKELSEIKKTRQLVGLPPLKMGYRNCLRCDTHFFSEDVRNQRNCECCRRDRVVGAPVRENL